MAPRTKKDVWSPYGHEPARRALLNMRRAQIVIAAIAIALAYAFFLQLTLQVDDTTKSSSTEVPTEPKKQKPITVTVAPGRMAEFAQAHQEAPEGRSAPPIYKREDNVVLEKVQPLLSLIAPLAGALWLLSRVGTSARGKLAELNLGVYKGAMPYEMHTARAYKQVFTYREVDGHVFGKAREDFLFGSYLGAPPLSVRRLLGEPIDAAKVTHLRRGGTPRVTVTAPTRQPGPLDRIVTPLRAAVARVQGTKDPRAQRVKELRRRSGSS